MSFARAIGVLQDSGLSGPTLYSAGLTAGTVGEMLDTSKDRVAIDLLKTCRNFAPIGNPLAYPEQAIVTLGTTGAQSGWPTQSFVAVLLTNAVPADYGTYTAAFTGTGVVTCVGTGTASTIISLSYNATNNVTSFGIVCAGDIILQFTSLSSDFRSLQVFRPGYHIGGNTATFTNEFLGHASRSAVLRFTDMMEIDNSPDVSWTARSSITYGSVLRSARDQMAGIQMCNAGNRAGWFQIPHGANNTYISTWLGNIDTSLNSTLKAYIEYSNTTWDNTKTQYTGTYNGAQSATLFCVGRSTVTNRIIAMQRNSNTVTVQLNVAHTRSVGQTVAIFGIAGIPSGYYVITAVPGGKIFQFTQSGADTTFTLSTTDDTNLVIPIGDNFMAQPLKYSTADLTVRVLVQRMTMNATRILWTNTSALATKTRMRFVYSHDPANLAELPEVLGWAKDQWGTLSTWLYGVSSEAMLSLNDPVACTAENVVISQLQASLPAVQSRMAALTNICAASGVVPMLNRWGIDTHTTPTPQVAAAVQAAHESLDIKPLLVSLMTSWRNYVGGIASIYRLGAQFTFGTSGANTWPLLEYDITSAGQPKYLGYKSATGISTTPVTETAVTTGTIQIPSLFPLSVFSSTPQGNGILSVSPSAPTITIQVYAPTAKNYTLEVYAAQHLASTSTMTVVIDSTTLVTGLALTGSSFDTTTTPAPLAYTTSVSLAAGMHLVKLSFPVHNSPIALRQITFN